MRDCPEKAADACLSEVGCLQAAHPIHLPIARYRLWFEAHQPIQLPELAGSTWRGVLGHSLKKALCVTREPECRSCSLVHSCVHAYIFETPPAPHASKMRKYPAAPHPFVLEAPKGAWQVQPDSLYPLSLTLIGRSHAHLPHLIHALDQGARSGVGRGRARMALTHVEQETVPGSKQWILIHEAGGSVKSLPAQMPTISPVPESPVTLHLDTPLRIKRQGRPLGPDALTFGDLFSNLLRRISLLSHFHSETPLETDFAGLTQAARQWPGMQGTLQWHDWDRYSSRQGRHIPMNGVVGSLHLAAEDLATFWPFLCLAPYIHIGAGTSMGQGACRLKWPGSY